MKHYNRKIVHMSCLGYVEQKFSAYYKIENRNQEDKVSIITNGLPIHNKEVYKVYEILKLENRYKLSAICTLDVDEKGYAKETLRGNIIHQPFIGLAIAKIDNNEELKKDNIILMGFVEKSITIEDISFINEKEEIISTIENQMKQPTKNENIRDQKEFKPFKDEMKNRQSKDTSKKTSYEKKETKNQKQETKNQFHQNQFNTLEYIKKQLEEKKELDLIDRLFQNNEKMKPFEKQDSIEWVKIEIPDLVFLPIEAWMMVNNAFLIKCYQKFKHLILGRDDKEGVILLGVPDIFYTKESLIANLCGFTEFWCCKSISPKSGEYGYWVIKNPFIKF